MSDQPRREQEKPELEWEPPALFRFDLAMAESGLREHYDNESSS